MQCFERAQAMAVSSLKTTFSHLSQDFLRDKARLWEDLMTDKKLWKLASHHNMTVSGEGGRKGGGRGKEGGREGGREGEREGGREGGREGRREGGYM